MIGREINLGSPKQLQVVLFDELGLPKTKRTKTGYTTDAEALQTSTPRPSTRSCWHLLRAPRRLQAAADRRGPAQVGRRRRPHPHHVQPDGRGDRPAVVAPTRTCRTSRSAPTRAAGSARPSSSARASSRLLTADYSQIEMRVMAHLSEDDGPDRGVPLRRGPAPLVASRVFGVRARRGHPEMRRKIKAMSYGLAYGLSAFGLSQQLGIERRRGERPDGRVLRAVRRRARLPARRRRRGPRAPATPRRCSAAAATCPTSPATTGSAARWPSGWRSTRRSRARPPTSSRSRCCGVDAALRPSGPARRGCCCRCTTSSSSRWRRGSAQALEALVRDGDGRGGRPLDRAARRLRRRRRHLGGRRPLRRQVPGRVGQRAGRAGRRLTASSARNSSVSTPMTTARSASRVSRNSPAPTSVSSAPQTSSTVRWCWRATTL